MAISQVSFPERGSSQGASLYVSLPEGHGDTASQVTDDPQPPEVLSSFGNLHPNLSPSFLVRLLLVRCWMSGILHVHILKCLCSLLGGISSFSNLVLSIAFYIGSVAGSFFITKKEIEAIIQDYFTHPTPVPCADHCAQALDMECRPLTSHADHFPTDLCSESTVEILSP